MIAEIIHALLVAGDNLDKVADELPAPICTDAQIMLTALARAAQLTAEQLKQEETAREAKLREAA